MCSAPAAMTTKIDEDDEDDEEESIYGAAYEEMTYQDSTDDDVEGEVLDAMPQRISICCTKPNVWRNACSSCPRWPGCGTLPPAVCARRRQGIAGVDNAIAGWLQPRRA